MQKKQTPKASKNHTRIKEIFGIFLMASGVFLFACMLLQNTGFLGTVIRPGMLGIFGLSAFVMPVVILTLGIGLIMMDRRKLRISKIILVAIMLIMTLNILHMIFLKDVSTISFGNFIQSSFQLGMDYKGAGAFAAILTYPVWLMIGTVGSLIAYLAVLSVSIILYGNISIRSVSRQAKENWETHRQQRQERKEEKKQEKQRLYQEKLDSIEKQEPNTPPETEDCTFFGERNAQNGIVNDIDREDERCAQPPPGGDKPSQSKRICVNDVSKYQPAFHMKDDAGFLPILRQPEVQAQGKNERELEQKADLLEQALESFGVEAKVSNITCGPTITRYELQLAYGVKVSKITALSDDIKMALSARDLRIEAPIPGKNAVGIEIPNDHVRIVYLREVLESDHFLQHKSHLVFALGIDIDGKSIVADLEKMPHLLIAGTTGSGKSVCINNLILSFLYNATPAEVKMIMVDPKMVELTSYNDLPHMLIPVVTDSKKAAGALRWALNEMEQRYKKFSECGVRQLSTYNANQKDEKLPAVVVVVDELADLMMVAAQEVEDIICRIAQKGRAAGIHLVLATQRPSVNVITGVIKANIPSRIAFQVPSQVDSRTILDMAGAERLLGRGDMLYYPNGAASPTRLQGAYVSEQEVREITDYIRERSQVEYDQGIVEAVEKSAADPNTLEGGTGEYDELLPEAAMVFMERKEASISLLQRKMRIGYARAARIVDEMEEMGIVSPPDGSRPRNVLINMEDYNRMFPEQSE